MINWLLFPKGISQRQHIPLVSLLYFHAQIGTVPGETRNQSCSARGFPLYLLLILLCLTVFSNLTLLFNKGGKWILIFHGTCTSNTYNESRLNEENRSFPEIIFGDKSVLVKLSSYQIQRRVPHGHFVLSAKATTIPKNFLRFR